MLPPKKKLPVFLSGPYGWWRLSTILMMGAMLSTLVISGFFIYNYTFRSLEDAHTIVTLNTDTVVNTVNLDNYQHATQILTAKVTSTTIPANPRNIFVYLSTSTPTSTYASASSN